MQNVFKTAIIPYQGELAGDVLQTPFAKAILLPDTVGTLLLVDANCTPMTRAWCVLEAWVTTTEATGKRFDVSREGRIMKPFKTFSSAFRGIQTILVRFYLFGPMGGVSTAESENGKGQKSFQGVKDHFFVAVVSSD